MSRSIILTTALAFALACSAAHAEQKPQMTIKIGDLDLTSPKDAQRLYSRVSAAASEVCGQGPLTVFIAGPPPEFVACRDATIDNTLKMVPAPLVQALRTGKGNDVTLAAWSQNGSQH